MEVVELAAEIIRSGGLVVYPTDTLYGLGADALSSRAIGKVYEAKERPPDVPLPVAVSDVEMMGRVAALTPWMTRVVEMVLPRPVTFLLPKKKRVPAMLTAGSSKIGVRIPNHIFALALLARTGPITTTSANLHEGHPPRTARSAIRQLGEAADLYVDCGRTSFGGPSTVIDISEGPEAVEVVRKGVVSPEELLRLIEAVEMDRSE
ncbi:MAG: L-threonylcarbamoyladenylate synthase [Thermoplasmata archaeon]